MEIEVRTDHHVEGDAALISFVKGEVAAGLESHARRITSVRVHLGEESGAGKGPHDLTCMVEVRLARHAPVAVTHHASTKDDAVGGAVDAMQDVLKRLFGRLEGRRSGAETIRRRTR
jgi:hypothetical protein